MLRRTRRGAEETPERLEAEGLLLDASRHRVTRDGQEVTLKPKEFDLLRYLMANAGRVLGRDQILARVWGYEYGGDTRTVDTHVKTLRERLGDRAERPRWIETVRGVGYRFRESTTRP